MGVFQYRGTLFWVPMMIVWAAYSGELPYALGLVSGCCWVEIRGLGTWHSGLPESPQTAHTPVDEKCREQ